MKKREITDDMLYGYFAGDVSEEKAISSWLAADDRNRKRYRVARQLYEQHLLNSPADVLEWRDRQSSKRASLMRHLWIAAANVAAVAVIAIVAIYVVPERISGRLAAAMTTVEARPGQQLDITLSDGTEVKLNSGAQISYPNMFSRKMREVQLSGEAYFDVAHDENHPFVVKTFASDVEVLGTEFSLEADKEAGRFSISLVEGSVRLRNAADPGEEMMMAPGDKVCMTDGHLERAGEYARSDVSWIEGLVDISGDSFAEVIGRLETAFGVDIVIDRQEMPEYMCVDGEVRLSDGIDYSLNVLGNLADFTWSKDFRTGTIYIR